MDRNVCFANSWQAWLERGEFILAIYWKARSVTLHYSRGGFDEMLIVSRYGISFD
ncbi:MAG: hypothetical protein JRN43_01035 [Nitrososphaerota archaeon]|nr:hypothetical protein [Nitrososphaerota archaeon]MDG7009275.1 hypothetical protein [Nitrososphaerota archaeon]MDG7018877.1 hypothetical protein [Nitrososphaerota archaeon]